LPVTEAIPYSVDIEELEDNPGLSRAIYIFNPIVNHRVKLGDEYGTASYGTGAAQHFLWFYTCGTCPTLQPGLYAYSLNTDTSSFVSDNAMRSYETLKVVEPWLIYVGATQGSRADLHAYNLSTGEHVLVADNLTKPLSDYLKKYYALNEGTVAWVSTSPEYNRINLNVLELSTHQSRQLDLPPYRSPFSQLRLSSGIVVWKWDYAWKGYDLSNDALFTIPETPPIQGLENVKVLDILPHERSIIWIVEAFWGKRAYSASVVEKVPGLSPTSQP
jgi:hypothetical protein